MSASLGPWVVDSPMNSAIRMPTPSGFAPMTAMDCQPAARRSTSFAPATDSPAGAGSSARSAARSSWSRARSRSVSSNATATRWDDRCAGAAVAFIEPSRNRLKDFPTAIRGQTQTPQAPVELLKLLCHIQLRQRRALRARAQWVNSVRARRLGSAAKRCEHRGKPLTHTHVLLRIPSAAQAAIIARRSRYGRMNSFLSPADHSAPLAAGLLSPSTSIRGRSCSRVTSPSWTQPPTPDRTLR